MRRTVVVAIVLLSTATTFPTARAQELLFQQPQVYDPAAAGQFLLAPTDTQVVGLTDTPAAPASSPTIGAIAGGVGGHGVSNQTNVSIGFTYIMPLWTYRDFQLAVPNQFKGAFFPFANIGAVDTQFAYAPRVNLDYYVADMDFSVGTSGTFFNLTGKIDRQLTNNDGTTGQLSAHSSLTIVSANLVEVGRQFAFLDLFPWKDPKHECVADSILGLRLASRYVSVDQNYTGFLTGVSPGTGMNGPMPGTNSATRFSSQTFRGIGISAAADWLFPFGNNWAWFFNSQQSLILGDNRRTSSISVIAPGFAGAPFSESLFDNPSSLVPITELEVGIEWGLDHAERLRTGQPPPRFTVKVAGVGQYWSGLGPLSAGSKEQGFHHSDLFLVGGYLQAAFKF